VSEITKDIFSTVPALTSEEAALVVGSFPIDSSYVNPPYYHEKVLGSASIAETHQTYSNEFQQQAVMKFIKPIYAYYFLCEINFLLADAWKTIPTYSRGNVTHIKQCRQLLMFFINEFIKEFDYYGEFVNTTIGYKCYNKPSQHVSSIVALECQINPFPVLILSFVKGYSVDHLLNQESLSRERFITMYKYVDNLIRIWFKTTLWGPGFFHADLHPGNLIMGDEEVNIIDFGSCGILTPEEQCAMVTAMIISNKFIDMPLNQIHTSQGRANHAHNLEVGEQFVKAIWGVCHVKSYSSAHLREITKKIIDLRFGKGLAFSTLFLDIIQYSNDIGVCTSSAVLLFGRACAYIGSLMKRVEDRCGDVKVCPQWSVDGIIKTNMMSNPMQLIRFYRQGSVC
jgi:serine/threonine protein kinase